MKIIEQSQQYITIFLWPRPSRNSLKCIRMLGTGFICALRSIFLGLKPNDPRSYDCIQMKGMQNRSDNMSEYPWTQPVIIKSWCPTPTANGGWRSVYFPSRSCNPKKSPISTFYNPSILSKNHPFWFSLSLRTVVGREWSIMTHTHRCIYIYIIICLYIIYKHKCYINIVILFYCGYT